MFSPRGFSPSGKINLPPDEASLAPFPPGCKVLCFDRNGFQVGMVKSVQVSISFSTGGTFDTFYEVESKGSLKSFQANSLRFTPGCPVYISLDYFGPEHQGSGEFIEGRLLGSFEMPCSECSGVPSKSASSKPKEKVFFYSVEVKIESTGELLEEHGIPPEYVKFRSTGMSDDARNTEAEAQTSSSPVKRKPTMVANSVTPNGAPIQQKSSNEKKKKKKSDEKIARSMRSPQAQHSKNQGKDISHKSKSVPTHQYKDRRIQSKAEDHTEIVIDDDLEIKQISVQSDLSAVSSEDTSYQSTNPTERTSSNYSTKDNKSGIYGADDDSRSSSQGRKDVNSFILSPTNPNKTPENPSVRTPDDSPSFTNENSRVDNYRKNLAHRSNQKLRGKRSEFEDGSTLSDRENIPAQNSFDKASHYNNLSRNQRTSSRPRSMLPTPPGSKITSNNEKSSSRSRKSNARRSASPYSSRLTNDEVINELPGSGITTPRNQLGRSSPHPSPMQYQQQATPRRYQSVVESERNNRHHQLDNKHSNRSVPSKSTNIATAKEGEYVDDDDSRFFHEQITNYHQQEVNNFNVTPNKSEEHSSDHENAPQSRENHEFNQEWENNGSRSTPVIEDTYNIVKPIESADVDDNEVVAGISDCLVSEEGCYLVYSSDSGGKLTLHYSRNTIPNSIGFWMPSTSGKPIQGFKFAQNLGRVELIKGIAGGDANKKKYYSGWCQFVKAARSHGGLICKWPDRGGIEVDLWVFFYDSCEILKIVDDQLFDVSAIDAVACVPRHSRCFEGMKTGELGQFLNRGNALGSSISMDGN